MLPGRVITNAISDVKYSWKSSFTLTTQNRHLLGLPGLVTLADIKTVSVEWTP